MTETVFVYRGEALAAYGFGDDHPFGLDRHDVFLTALEDSAAASRVEYREPANADRPALERFHTARYVDFVMAMSERGSGWLDEGDTPVFPGVFEAASSVVGTTLAAVDDLMQGNCAAAFVPIAGLHHARRDGAAGFCVFNDCGIAAEYLRERYEIRRVAYVDIDAHHGDGVFYGFESDPDFVFADIHEDGRYLYPGTGFEDETGTGAAVGTKLNICLPPGAGDEEFDRAWERVEGYLCEARPEFILFQCGADSVAGDPITHLELSCESHAKAARRLRSIAGEYAQGRLLATGGGGYNRANIGAAWSAVVQSLVG